MAGASSVKEIILMNNSGGIYGDTGFFGFCPGGRTRGGLVAALFAATLFVLPACAFGADGLDTGTPALSDIVTAIQRQSHDSDGSDFSVQARQRFPWFVSLGVYFPTFNVSGVSNSIGGEAAFGYRFPTDNFDFRISVRGQEFGITDAFGNNSTIDVTELSLDALYRVQGFYIGPGFSFGSVTGTTDGFTETGQNQVVFQLTAGYDISTRVFIEARWQTADVDAYDGISASVGLRF